MFIVQVVGIFDCATEEEARALADRAGEAVTAATKQDAGQVYCRVTKQKGTLTDFAEKTVTDGSWTN